MDYDIAGLLARTREAAAVAAARIRADFGAPRDVRHKGRIDLVTATDLAVEALLQERLAAILPEAAFLAEESAATTRLSGLTWIIDPLDGTTNFAHSFPFVCTSVALYDGQEPLLGCVYAPMLEQFFWAGRGLGAYCNGERLGVSTVAAPEAALVATGFPYAIRENLDEIMDVHFTPILMKKNRLATCLSLLCAATDAPRFKALIFRHTTTLGIKSFALEKTVLETSFERLETPLGPVTMKNALFEGAVIRSKPELEDCREMARRHDIPLTEVYACIGRCRK